nr:hypothetical protein [Tanacetum cinerariifolium]
MRDDDDDIGDLDDYLNNAPYYVDEEEEEFNEMMSKLLGIPYKKPPTFKSKKFKVIKYSFESAKEYVAIKEYEYDIWIRAEENMSRVYQKIINKKDGGCDSLFSTISTEKAWATIEELARYEDEGWNDPVIVGERSLDYENLAIEQLLGVTKCKVDTHMKEAISLMRRSESIFGRATECISYPQNHLDKRILRIL